MRVYEFAKEYGFSNKQVLSVLKEAGVDIKSHMSVLDDSACKILELKLLSADSNVEKEGDVLIDKKQVSSDNNSNLHSGGNVQLGKNKSSNNNVNKKKKHNKKKFLNEKELDKASEKVAGVVLKSMLVGDLAGQAGIPATDLIVTLLKWGVVATKNQMISEDIVARVADHFEVPIKKNVLREKVFQEVSDTAIDKNLQSRLPIVVIVGHVDHGKTTLLDFIRKTRVTAQEKGGITQHLGAYEAHTDKGNIVFIDTPGHAAFGKIRQRGVRVADIVILIVAADDGVMPQTVESIKRAKEMNVPIIVAINKADKVDDSQIEVVKRQLAQYNVLPEDWGGDAICVSISAITGQGVDELLDMINLQAEMLELRASFSGFARGYVLESEIKKGRGSVATVILQNGMLAIGDHFICGGVTGKVVTLTNSFGKAVKKIGPSLPVLITGFDDLPQVGDFFQVVSKEVYKKQRDGQKKTGSSGTNSSWQECLLRLVIKADTNSSKEAIVDSIMKLSEKMKHCISIVNSGVGNITEGDIEFAYNTGSEILGLHVKTESKALSLAQNRMVSVDHFDIIYKLLEEVERRVVSRQKVEVERVKIGQAVVLRVFNIKRIGVIAGCKVEDGKFVRSGYIFAYRGNEKIGEGKIVSLQREKKSVQEVNSGYECGFVVENISEWQEGDRAECYVEHEKK